MKFDNLIIGAGQAGPALANRLTAAGQTVALVERHLFGGTCVNTGCMPTKTLVASAAAAQAVRRAADYGVIVPGEFRVDPQAVARRQQAVSAKARQGVESWLRGMKGCTVVQGHARFKSPHAVQVGEQELQAERIFLNVGGRARIPALPGVEQIQVLTNSSMLALEVLPEHLVVVGGSYIGLEFAQIYRRFGCRVTVVEKGPRLVSREDPDVSEAVAEILQGEGVELRLHAECIHFARRGEHSVVGVACQSGEPEVIGSHVLLALGRQPNTDDLGLDQAGLKVDAHGYLVVDEELRTNQPHIWALGDCNGRGAFTHTAYNDFELLAANLLDQEQRRVSDRVLGYALYTDPPLARAGMTETEARQRGHRVRLATRPMSRVGRAVEKGDTRGFLKFVVDADSDLILGASLLGIGCDEVIHSVLQVMAARLPYTALQRTMPVHPTVSELLPTTLEGLSQA